MLVDGTGAKMVGLRGVSTAALSVGRLVESSAGKTAASKVVVRDDEKAE